MQNIDIGEFGFYSGFSMLKEKQIIDKDLSSQWDRYTTMPSRGRAAQSSEWTNQAGLHLFWHYFLEKKKLRKCNVWFALNCGQLRADSIQYRPVNLRMIDKVLVFLESQSEAEFFWIFVCEVLRI